MEVLLFEERQSLCWRYILPVLVLTAYISYFVTTNPQMHDADRLMVRIIALLGLVAAAGFSSMRTRVTREALHFGFPLWRKRAKLTALTVEGIEPMKLWYGIGVQWMGGMWIYTVHMGEGVKVRINGRPYLIGSRDPVQLQQVLLRLARDRVMAG
jgi:hypothetical protein